MDPNENLKELRVLADCLANSRYTSARAQADDARRLAELVFALDGWLSKGGFLPKAWERAPKPDVSERERIMRDYQPGETRDILLRQLEREGKR